ncbi:bifunctional indole-3-glycerol-phosphate synthase TrpC/phosphoribosylanthranilate isomerase TrpF [Alginatibacterium sediminis]|uniref:Multifunctional fusion protein n=1 Tax=Alginatibacterium sediminis TaxID=2164068 RepID=A0A420EIC0_9ALTE|nr:bifunctional indole-3-glycerol-phosphate synthase TrpC/phosphoribosylanthranilate isomerase TrpF [Alginatibacterium sediminis]RKF20403.1 bifunctional indole-3-glycerol-phosphate synthase TrpC/phosphoribosylanthranilate isomerase TrpF [Alginatibacterium sediminis]
MSSSTGTILDQIVADRRIWLEAQQQKQPLDSFISKIEPSDRDFYAALSGDKTHFILECKKASPSKGLIRDEFDLDIISSAYKNWASAISVLTESKYFQGDFAYINQVRQQVSQPILCKDFMIDPYQVYLARYSNADAILLMLSVLDDKQYQELSKLAAELNLGVLTEVSNPLECERAIALNAKVIGINNRNLRDLSISLERTEQLSSMIPSDRIVISESGIHTHQQVMDISQFANGFLVGSSIMAQADIDMACRQLILGNNKVCGLTRAEDVHAVYAAGSVYGGLIFAEKSPRCVSFEQAKLLVSEAALKFVGVFVNAPVDQVASYAIELGLSAVQLHGSEDATYIESLRTALPASTSIEIWKALGVNDSVPTAPKGIDRILLDAKVGSQSGGTGQVFDWQLINHKYPEAMLAGGLNPSNIELALAQACYGLDLNSGLETSPGIKDTDLIKQAFTTLRAYPYSELKKES